MKIELIPVPNAVLDPQPIHWIWLTCPLGSPPLKMSDGCTVPNPSPLGAKFLAPSTTVATLGVCWLVPVACVGVGDDVLVVAARLLALTVTVVVEREPHAPNATTASASATANPFVRTDQSLSARARDPRLTGSRPATDRAVLPT